MHLNALRRVSVTHFDLLQVKECANIVFIFLDRVSIESDKKMWKIMYYKIKGRKA